jgi:micrococcal nuclease|tara:strand:- start:12371 stop:12796 length:426 start_codon:yes stop_codon:yes gene_type:complete
MYEYGCTVERVVDGDTIDVVLDLGFDIRFKSRVRLYGIDTPESRTRDKDEKVRGKMAATFLKNAVDKGTKIVIETKLKDSRGKYGRVLGNVIVDGLNINETMVINHLAVAYFGQSKNDVEAEHLINREKLIELGKFTPVED